MAIIINIDVMLAKRKMSVTELADKVGITMANISVLKNGSADGSILLEFFGRLTLSEFSELTNGPLSRMDK